MARGSWPNDVPCCGLLQVANSVAPGSRHRNELLVYLAKRDARFVAGLEAWLELVSRPPGRERDLAWTG